MVRKYSSQHEILRSNLYSATVRATGATVFCCIDWYWAWERAVWSKMPVVGLWPSWLPKAVCVSFEWPAWFWVSEGIGLQQWSPTESLESSHLLNPHAIKNVGMLKCYQKQSFLGWACCRKWTMRFSKEARLYSITYKYRLVSSSTHNAIEYFTNTTRGKIIEFGCYLFKLSLWTWHVLWVCLHSYWITVHLRRDKNMKAFLRVYHHRTFCPGSCNKIFEQNIWWASTLFSNFWISNAPTSCYAGVAHLLMEFTHRSLEEPSITHMKAVK